MPQSGTDRDGRLPHACLVAAPTAAAALKKAGELAAAAVCSGQGPKPCGACRDCRKAFAGIHPDIITLRRQANESGKLKQNITVDQIRALSADAIVLPNEAGRKVYIIDEAETMNPAAQNAALKLLEEPPAGVVFLLCTTNALLLLPTVRSRCTLIGETGEAEAADDAAAALAQGFLRAAAAGDAAELLRWCTQNENLDTAGMAAFLDALRGELADLLCGRRKLKGLAPAELMRMTELADRCAEYLKVNTNVKHLFGLLAVCALPESERKQGNHN